jgi:hypothetical protein
MKVQQTARVRRTLRETTTAAEPSSHPCKSRDQTAFDASIRLAPSTPFIENAGKGMLFAMDDNELWTAED